MALLSLPATCLVLAACVFGATAAAQRTSIVLQAVDGKNGVPLARKRLLIFAGQNEHEVKIHKIQLETVTDDKGLATIVFPSASAKRMNVFVDFHTLCRDGQDPRSFDVDDILQHGSSTPNNCGTSSVKTAPGQFIVYARTPTFREKMNW